jgi:hypothetical protein
MAEEVPTMLTELLATADAYATGARFLANLTADFASADWQVEDGASHNPRWIVGHLAASRRNVLKLVGLPQPAADWEPLFGRGSAATGLPAELDMVAILADVQASQALLAGRWDALTAEALAAPFPRRLPNGSELVGGALQFLAWHEAYHLGQLGLLRRLAGKVGLA